MRKTLQLWCAALRTLHLLSILAKNTYFDLIPRKLQRYPNWKISVYLFRFYKSKYIVFFKNVNVVKEEEGWENFQIKGD